MVRERAKQKVSTAKPSQQKQKQKRKRQTSTTRNRARVLTAGITPTTTSYDSLDIQFVNSDYKNRLDAFVELKRNVLPTRYIDDDVLLKLGLKEDVEYLFNRLGWMEFMFSRDHTYERLTIEFLCSLEIELFGGKHVKFGKVSFQLMNNNFNFTLSEFNRILGLPVVEDGDRKTPRQFNVHEFWWSLSELKYDSSTSRSNSIINPCFRYIHRLLSQTIFGRKNSADKVRVDELYLMHCMVEGHRVDVGAFLVNHLSHVAHSKSKDVLVGGLVTTIARKLGLSLTELSVVKGSNRLNFSACIAMKMVEQVGGKYNWLIEDPAHNKIIRVSLPDIEHTTICKEANWLRTHVPNNEQPPPIDTIPSTALIPFTDHNQEYDSNSSQTPTLAELFQEQRRQGTLLVTLASQMETVMSTLSEIREWQLRHDSSHPPAD